MAIFDVDLDYTQLIRFTDGTLQLGSFVQIRNALIKRMKEIYGNDIDISPASADGQYVNSLALIFNNILQALKKGNDSMDPAAATGQYLDTLCSFNNVQRIHPTASVAQLYLRNETGSDIVADRLTFIDKNNTLWVWDGGGVSVTIPTPTADKAYYQLIGVECEELGPVSAKGTNAFYEYDSETQSWVEVDSPVEQSWDNPALYGDSDLNGTIYKCVEYAGLYVWQYEDAITGNAEETDESLRSRRYQMLGNTSVTVLQGLKSNLLGISGIQEAFLFNNPATADGDTELLTPQFEPIADETSLKGHSVYIVLRYRPGVIIEDADVGKAIYSKMTPGIPTNPFAQPGMSKYILTTEEPRDWSKASGRYLNLIRNNTDEFFSDKFYKNNRDGTFSRLDSRPDDWSTNYTDYYKIHLNSSSVWAANSFVYPEEAHMYEIVRTGGFSDFVYWKVAKGKKIPIWLELRTNPKLYDYPEDKTNANTNHTPVEKNIIEALKKGIRSAKIDEFFSIATLLTLAQQADILKNGMNTFAAYDGEFFPDTDYGMIYPMDLEYLECDDSDFHFWYEVDGSGLPTGKAVITIEEAQ